MTFLLSVIFFLNGSYLLMYGLLTAILTLLYLHPQINSFFQPILLKLLFGKEHSFFMHDPPVKIWTATMMSEKKIKQMAEVKDEDAALYKIHKQAGKYKQLFDTVSVLFFLNEWGINLFEKMKNLINWR